MTWSSGQPRAMARSRSAYWRLVLSVFSKHLAQGGLADVEVRPSLQVARGHLVVLLGIHGRTSPVG